MSWNLNKPTRLQPWSNTAFHPNKTKQLPVFFFRHPERFAHMCTSPLLALVWKWTVFFFQFPLPLLGPKRAKERILNFAVKTFYVCRLRAIRFAPIQCSSVHSSGDYFQAEIHIAYGFRSNKDFRVDDWEKKWRRELMPLMWCVFRRD